MFVYKLSGRGFKPRCKVITFLQKLLGCYKKDIQQKLHLKTGDARAIKKLFNFLVKYQAYEVFDQQNPLDTADMMGMIWAKLSLHLQEE